MTGKAFVAAVAAVLLVIVSGLVSGAAEQTWKMDFAMDKSDLSSTGTNQWIQFTTTSIPAGTYQLQLVYRSNATRAKHNVKVDSTTFGLTIDQYAATAFYQTVTVGSITFATAGTHTIRLTTTAKNAASSGFDLSAVQFILTPP